MEIIKCQEFRNNEKLEENVNAFLRAHNIEASRVIGLLNDDDCKVLWYRMK